MGLKVRETSKTDSGFTILEVLVACAIGTVFLLGMLSMVSNGLKMQKHLLQKYEVLDFGALARLNLSQPNFCSCNFPSAMNLSAATISIPRLNTVSATACSPATGVLASSVAPNNTLSGSSSGLKIQSIKMQNINLINAVNATSNLYSFDIQIDFDPTTAAYAIKPLVISGLTATTSVVAASSELITSCSVAGSTTSGTLSTVTVEQMCTALGGTYTRSSGPCVLPTPARAATPSMTIAQTCVSLGGVYTAPAGPCVFGGGGSASVPKGTIIAQCTWTQGTVGCSGGASMPNLCPTGTVISNYNSAGPNAETGSFECKTN